VNSVFEALSHLNCVSYIAAFWRGNFGGNYKFSGGGAGCAKTVHSYFKEEGTTRDFDTDTRINYRGFLLMLKEEIPSTYFPEATRAAALCTSREGVKRRNKED
jgi:hypothetical protein